MTPEAVMRELAGLHALARSLVHGDGDADDLLQETAIAAIEHPPDDERPVRPWLATVLRNRWRMDRRGRSRRELREQGIEVDDQTSAPEALDRARTLERLASALVTLEEPFRTVVIRRYLDGQSAAEIARALQVPAGTVRWRLKTGLERLRAALDESTPRWQRALAPFAVVKGAVAMKAKYSLVAALVLLLLLGAGAIVFFLQRARTDTRSSSVPIASVDPKRPGLRVADLGGDAGSDVARPDPLPGQGRVAVEDTAAEGGVISGRVINWSTGDGVATAELTFTSSTGVLTVRVKDDGSFELAPPAAGVLSLTTIIAPGFLPYAPEFQHSPVRIALGQAGRAGVTLFLFPALDYYGTVIDGAGSPVAGAKVKLVAPPAGEQTLEKIATEWTTDKKGEFVFHAPDFTVFEASRGKQRGWAMLDGNVATTKKMVIKIGDAAARDATIRGKTVDATGAPIADVVVTAIPEQAPGPQTVPRSVAFATSAPDGTFVLESLDRDNYRLTAELDDYARARQEHVAGGTQNVSIMLAEGQSLAGLVRDPDDKPVPAYTLLVTKREGLIREVVTTRSVIDPRGRFSVRVAPGDYELMVSATGWAPSSPVKAAAGSTDIKITLGAGAVLQGVVVDGDSGEKLSYARVALEGAHGGASAQPANAGTVTRADGSFELAGIPPGPFTISIGGGGYHPRLEGGMVATEGGTLGPIRIPLKKLAEGETPKLQLVGIGVQLTAKGDKLEITNVIPNSGAAAAGIVDGDYILAIDGIPVTELGLDGAVDRIRGAARTKLAVTIGRGQQVIPLTVERKPLNL